MAALLAAQPQEADPRAAFAYHALTYGWLCGELVRRVDGRSVGRFFADEVAAPLRLEAWIGLPAAVEARVAQLELAPNWGESAAMDPAQADDAMLQAIWGNPPLFEDELPWNTRAFRAAELPGANGIGAARSIARLYGCLARGGELDGVRLLSEATLALGRQEASRGYEPFVEKDMAFGVGFALQTPAAELGPPPDAFGHGGAGGSMHGAWPRERAGFSYVMNRLRDDEDTDPRADALLAALHAAVGAADARGQAPSAA
jgi:CubicO group peptidase (beta-lactamase class C family)